MSQSTLYVAIDYRYLNVATLPLYVAQKSIAAKCRNPLTLNVALGRKVTDGTETKSKC
jgi:hypothetical protein